MAFLQQMRRRVPVKRADLIGALTFSFVILIFVTVYDIQMHDRFVLTTYGCDLAENKDRPECKPITGSTSYQVNIQGSSFAYEIQGRQWYWIMFNAVAWGFTAIIAFFRGYLMMNVKAGIMWALTVILPFYGGFEDIAYFAFKSEPIPAEMPWLNSNPFISLVAGGQIVTPTILYTSIIIVVVILVIGWYLALRRK